MSAEFRPLDARLVRFASIACMAARRMPRDPVGTNIATQLARSASSPAAQYSEARGAASPRDYIAKMTLNEKELRESLTWIRIARGAGFDNADYDWLDRECNELIAIVVTCVRKARGRKDRPDDDRKEDGTP